MIAIMLKHRARIAQIAINQAYLCYEVGSSP